MIRMIWENIGVGGRPCVKDEDRVAIKIRALDENAQELASVLVDQHADERTTLASLRINSWEFEGGLAYEEGESGLDEEFASATKQLEQVIEAVKELKDEMKHAQKALLENWKAWA